MLPNRAETYSVRILAVASMGCIFRLAAMAACLLPAIASDREWTDSTGTYTVEADFVSLVDGQVSLKCDDGRAISLPFERLSQADQQYVRQQSSQAGSRSPGFQGGKGHAAGRGTTTVAAEGVGTSPDEALKDAFRMAVQAVVGTVVDGETLIENDALIRDKVLTYSNGFVTTYDRLSESQQDGLFRTRIWATVARNKLIVRLENEKIITRKVEGKGLFAEAVTTLEREKDAAQIMRRVFEGFPGIVLKADAVGKPRIVEKSENEATIGITVRFSVDQKAYSEWIEATRPILEKLAVKHSTQAWSIQRFHRQGSLPPIDTPNGQAVAWEFAQLRFPWNERGRHVSVERWGKQSISESDVRKSYTTLSAAAKGLGGFFPHEYRGKKMLSVLDHVTNGQVATYQLESGPHEEVLTTVFAEPLVMVTVKDEGGRRLLQVERVAFFGGQFVHRFHASVFWRVEYGLHEDQFLYPLPLPLKSGNRDHIFVAPYLIGTGQGTPAFISAFRSEFVCDLSLDDLQQAATVDVTIRSENQPQQSTKEGP